MPRQRRSAEVNSVWNDLIHAGRALAKARAFAFVCVVSLGIGMAPVIAIPYFSRLLTIQPVGAKTEGLVEMIRIREQLLVYLDDILIDHRP